MTGNRFDDVAAWPQQYLPLADKAVLTFMPHYNGETATFDIYSTSAGPSSAVPPWAGYDPVEGEWTHACTNITREDAARIVARLQHWIDAASVAGVSTGRREAS